MRRPFILNLISVVLAFGVLEGTPCWGDNQRVLIRKVETATVASPHPTLLNLAQQAVSCAVSRSLAPDMEYLAVIDYSLPSSQQRFWLLERSSLRVLFHDYVAHGKNSGEGVSTEFSNEIGSLQSSLGLFVVGETYEGRHGYSLRLHGLEPGLNDRAYERALVVHGADYVSPEFIKAHGRLGRSFGCPALPQESARQIIDILRQGAYLFAYASASGLQSDSSLLNCKVGV